MNIFAVYYDNGESYEDHYCGVYKLFFKKEDAIKLIEDEGYVPGDENSIQAKCLGPQFWQHEDIEEYTDSTGHTNTYNWGTEYMYVKEVEVL